MRPLPGEKLNPADNPQLHSLLPPRRPGHPHLSHPRLKGSAIARLMKKLRAVQRAALWPSTPRKQAHLNSDLQASLRWAQATSWSP